MIPVTAGHSALGASVPMTGTLCIRPGAIGAVGSLPLGPAWLLDAAFFGTHVRAHCAPLAAPELVLTVHLPQGEAPEVGSVADLYAVSHVLVPA